VVCLLIGATHPCLFSPSSSVPHRSQFPSSHLRVANPTLLPPYHPHPTPRIWLTQHLPRILSRASALLTTTQSLLVPHPTAQSGYSFLWDVLIRSCITGKGPLCLVLLWRLLRVFSPGKARRTYVDLGAFVTASRHRPGLEPDAHVVPRLCTGGATVPLYATPPACLFYFSPVGVSLPRPGPVLCHRESNTHI
jgi:hypothetical protein